MTTRKSGRFSFKRPSNGGCIDGDDGVVVKKEPEWSDSPPTKRVKSSKRKQLLVGRGARIDEMQKLHGLALVEFAQSFVGEDFIKLADSFGLDPDETAVRGLLSCGTRRAMVKSLWIDVKVRDIICRIMLPDGYPERRVSETVLAFGKAYTHLSSKFRKTVDDYCVSLLVGMRDAFGEGKQLDSILGSQASFDEYFELGREDMALFWGFASTAVSPEYLVHTPGRDGLSSTEGNQRQWRDYILMVTACYVRKRLLLLKESGGQLSANGGIIILSSKEIRELHDNFFRGRSDRLPPLGALPSGIKEWGNFNKHPEKLLTLVEIVDDIVNDNLKSLAMPNLAQANQNLKKLEKAITYDEVQVEDKIDIFDTGHLVDIEDELPEVLPGKYQGEGVALWSHIC